MSDRRITDVYRFANGMLMVFDQHGKQMEEFQGKADEVMDKLRAAYQGQIKAAAWKDGGIAVSDPSVVSDDMITWYESAVRRTAIYPEAGEGSLAAITYCLLGLGEVGEAQGKLKKVLRGDRELDDAMDDILDECGDALWYITRIADESGIGLRALMKRNAEKVISRRERGVQRGDGDHR